MIIAQLITIALLYYQVTMPAVENGKYHAVYVNGQLYMVNTQHGTVDKICDQNLNCEEIEK